MATIKQVGPGRRTVGTIDGIIYVTRNGKTYARATPIIPAKVYQTPAALKRQAIFKLIQMHIKYHLRTIKKTITPSENGTVSNRYYSINYKPFSHALEALADRYVAGEDVSLIDVEAAISAYATEHPASIRIAALSGYGEVFLTGEWPSVITLHAYEGCSTTVIIVAESGTTTTINPDGTTTVTNGSSSGTGGSGPETPSVEAPVINGTTPFTESTEATITGPAGASIYYTVDGSIPTAESTLYNAALTLSDTTIVKAVAIKNGVSSTVTSKTFTKAAGGSESE